MARPSKSLVPRLDSRRIVAGSERHVWNAAGLVKRTMAGSRGGPSAACRPFPYRDRCEETSNLRELEHSRADASS